MPDILSTYASASRASLGFFWKAGWAFVLGYAISGMIQAFVPRRRLTRYMGGAGPKSVGLASGFGAISSSCSFAALGAARTLIGKGASVVAGVAFMFASTNLVIELGILIVIFLGWPYLVAELAGGLVLIGLSSALIRMTAPSAMLERIRRRAERDTPDEDDDFDWRARLTSADGWRLVGHRFVMEWKMVWEEIAVGFILAGAVAVVVPDSVWRALFLAEADGLPAWLVALENAVVGPLVAASTFIGSMGNIPLATVLASSGAAFAGIMAFIYSDLMVPPLVRVNAKYYGWRGALYIAGVMFVAIVATALLLHAAMGLLDATVTPRRTVIETTTFALDYSSVLNVAFALVAAVLVWLHRRHVAGATDTGGGHHDHGGDGLGAKQLVVIAFLVVWAGGMLVGLLGELGALSLR